VKLHTPSRPPESRTTSAAFTLVEIVIVMTILAVLAAASVPTFRGIARERTARAPLVALVDMAKEARLRAMKEKRPYQIAFTAQGFTASRYSDPYLTLADLEEFVIKEQQQSSPPPVQEEGIQPSISDTAAATAEDTTVTAPLAAEWMERQAWPPGSTATAQVWHQVETSPAELQGENVVLWVFQPSGICEPLWLTLTLTGGSLQAEFGSLTADIIRETSTF
jgi:prepilin-type N-terminal cleavage/methylation domain-containing protein